MSQSSTALAKPSGFTAIEVGRRPDDRPQEPFGLLAMFTGTSEDVQNYGRDHLPGDFLHGLTGEIIGTAGKANPRGDVTEAGRCEIAPIPGVAFATYALWEPGSREPTYSYPSWEKVPEKHRSDFVWQENEDGTRTPPIGTETIHAIMLVKGQESPFLFRFKRTGLTAWDGKRGIRRFLQQFGPCWFELSSTEGKNAAGQPYRAVSSRFIVKMTDEKELAAVGKIKADFDKWRAMAEKLEESPAAASATPRPYIDPAEANKPMKEDDIPF